ncbi:MAG: hypothetical protein AB1796_04575 [Bacillota bacterium]
MPAASFGELLQQARADLDALGGLDKAKVEGNPIPGQLINGQLVKWQLAGGPANPAGGPANQVEAEQPSHTGSTAALPELHDQSAGSLAQEAEAYLAQAAYNRAVSMALSELEQS